MCNVRRMILLGSIVGDEKHMFFFRLFTSNSSFAFFKVQNSFPSLLNGGTFSKIS